MSQLFAVLWNEALWENWVFGIYWGLQSCQAVFPRAFDYSLWRADGSSSFFTATKLQPLE